LGLAGVEGALVGVSIAGGVTAGYVAQIYCSGAAAQLSSHATAIASPHGLMIRRSPEPAVTPHDGLGVLVLGALAATALYRGLRAPVSKLKDVLVVEHMMPQESGYFQSVRNGLRGYPPPDTEN